MVLVVLRFGSTDRAGDEGIVLMVDNGNFIPDMVIDPWIIV